jgi:hypothetical protein
VEFGQNGNLENNMNDWIPVSERLPPDNRMCVTRFQAELDGASRGGGIRLKEHFEIDVGIAKFGSRKAIDWILIPEPPKQDA